MTQRTRTIVLSSLGIILFAGLAAWWYSGFSLDFMRFFAASPATACVPLPSCVYSGPPFCAFDPTPGVVYCPRPSTIINRPTPPPGSTSSGITCTPATQTVAVGAPATLSASGGNGTFAWFAPRATSNGASVDGVAGSSLTISYTGSGTKKVTLQSSRADGSGNVDSTVCTVVVQ